jgi:replicative DNA helicase
MTQTCNFSNEFQDLILACLVQHPGQMLKFDRVLTARQFSGTQATIVAEVALAYVAKYGKFPGWETLVELAEKEARRIEVTDDDAPNKMREYLTKLRQLDTSDIDYVTERVVDFAREREVIAAVRKVIDHIKDAKPVDFSVVKLFEDALAVGQDLDDMGYILHAHADQIVDKVTARDYGIPTGYPLLDQVWRNGWGPGWLVVPLAPPKRYKTAFAINLALNMVSPAIGCDVLYYTCEISQELAALRALTNITGKNLDYLWDSPEKFKAAVRESMPRTLAANLLFKGFSSKTATIGMIKSHAKQAIRQFGLNPRVIVIDYAETVRPTDTKNVKDYRQQSDIYTEARALAHELRCTVIMPDRCNRETVGKAVPNMTSFQGAFEKAGIVDVAIGLCATDAEFQQDIIRFFIFINRHGRAHQHFRGSVSPEVMQIRIDEEIPYDPDQEDAAERPSRRRRYDDQPSALPDDLA